MRKQTYIRRRQWVIILTLIATIAAALGTSLVVPRLIQISFGVIAVVLPIIGSYLLNDVVQFVGETDWIHNRYAAERIRQQIYLYRTRSGPYAELEDHLVDDVLAANIRKIREEMEGKLTLPPLISRPGDDAAIRGYIKQAMQYSEGDDGLKAIDLPLYRRVRVDDQRKWYERKGKIAFNDNKRFYRWAQVAMLTGALFSAVTGVASGLFAGGDGLSQLFSGLLSDTSVLTIIIITNAIADSITSWSNVTLLGATYSVFNLTSERLDTVSIELAGRLTNPTLTGEDKEAISHMFIVDVEKILEWEREKWYEHVLQTRREIDSKLSDELNKYLKDDSSEAENG